MATRSNIVILKEDVGFPMSNLCEIDKESNIILYHHWDGYPENMMKIIEECISGSDWDETVIVDNLLNYDDDFREEGMVSGDIEWLYMIDIEGQLVRYLNVWGEVQYFHKNGEKQSKDDRYMFGMDEE